MAAHQKEPQHLGFTRVGDVIGLPFIRGIARDSVANPAEIAQGLGHLLCVHHHGAAMHPGRGQRPAERAFALGDFILVMRELQVRAPAMDVERHAQQAAAHGRTFDMPARAPRAIGGIPARVGRFFGLRGLPEHEIQRILLARRHRHSLPGAQVVQRLARQLAVAGKLAHGEIHVAVGALIGQPLGRQGGDDLQHARHMLRGAGFGIGRLHPQGALVGMHGGDEEFGQRANRHAALHRAADDLVVDVGDVAHILHLIARSPQPALHDIEAHQHARMAQVAEVIDRHAADIHAHHAWPNRLERRFLASQGVVDVQHAGIERVQKGPWHHTRADTARDVKWTAQYTSALAES
ncbi:hypothetical protein CDEF62S_04092 [Castellaniella defragrans]